MQYVVTLQFRTLFHCHRRKVSSISDNFYCVTNNSLRQQLFVVDTNCLCAFDSIYVSNQTIGLYATNAIVTFIQIGPIFNDYFDISFSHNLKSIEHHCCFELTDQITQICFYFPSVSQIGESYLRPFFMLDYQLDKIFKSN